MGAGGLIGYLRLSAVEYSFASGAVDGIDSGGLVGVNSESEIRHSFAVGSASGENAGGLAGSNRHGQIQASFALASVSGRQAGGLVGDNLSGKISQSFASGDVVGQRYAGGLVGHTVPGSSSGEEAFPHPLIEHSLALSEVHVTPVLGESGYGGGLAGYSRGSFQRDAYALGTVHCDGSEEANESCTVGGVVGHAEDADWERVYFNLDAYPEEGPPLLAGTATGSLFTGDGLTLASLRTASCSAESLFTWDDDGDDADGDGEILETGLSVTPRIACTSAEEPSFPWDFGDGDELPVPNAMLGEIFDAAEQRLFIEHALALVDVELPTEGYGVETTLTLPFAMVTPAGGRLESHWYLPTQGELSVVDDRHGETLTVFAAVPGTFSVRVLVLVRDANDALVDAHAAQMRLRVTRSTVGDDAAEGDDETP